eukprot:Opistho-2@95319
MTLRIARGKFLIPNVAARVALQLGREPGSSYPLVADDPEVIAKNKSPQPATKAKSIVDYAAPPTKLIGVTMTKSWIRQPPLVEASLRALGLTRMHKTIIHKNCPSINGIITRVMGHVKVTPIVVKEMNADPEKYKNVFAGSDRSFLNHKGEYVIFRKAAKGAEQQQQQ